jgi:hypothetical protein
MRRSQRKEGAAWAEFPSPWLRHYLRELLKTGVSVSGPEMPLRSGRLFVSGGETIGWSVAINDTTETSY